MRRSAQVILVLSGALLNGCSRESTGWGDGDDSSEVLTNNTYVTGHGYYHAPYHAFYPFPYNHFSPGRGYYHGGNYTEQPDKSGISASSPNRSLHTTSRGGFTRSSTRVGTIHS